jgi:prepilin signal peptidase PulO-like enzyme (type II secretory pathway)
MMPVLFTLLGLPVGFLLDRWIARLALEPYERGEIEEEDLRLKKGEAAAIIAVADSRDFEPPRALTVWSAYRRAAVIGVTVLLYAVAAWRYENSLVEALIVSGYVAALIVCTATDVLAYRVPNVVTYPSILAAIVVGMTMPDADRLDVALGGLITGGTFLAMSIATRGGMGMGDVKLAFFVGFALGLALGVVSLLITAIAGGVIAVLLMVTRVRSRRDPIPYAPFIAIGALYVLLTQGSAFSSL